MSDNKVVLLKEKFEKVQKIPYNVCQFDRTKIDEDLKFGDCRHKSELLYKLLKNDGFEVMKTKVIFDWRDLPLPSEILNILQKSSSIWTHDSLKVKISNKWINVDCTWNLELENKGFPVTIKWTGKKDTEQITKGKLEFYEEGDFNLRKEEILKKYKIKIDKEEAYKFADKLNNYLRVL